MSRPRHAPPGARAARGLARAGVAALAALAAMFAPTPAAARQTPSAAADAPVDGDYALAVDGTVIMTVRLRSAGGALDGTVSAGGKSLPVSGTVRDGRAQFVTAAPSGGFLHWEAQAFGAGLAVTMTPAGTDGRSDRALAQRHVLVRRTGGTGGGISRATQQWIIRLSAVADSITVWCASPSYRETDVCAKALVALRRVAPALMVARFTSGGQATALLRVLASGPGAPAPGAGMLAVPVPATSATGDLLAALEPPRAEPPAPEPPPDARAPAGPVTVEPPLEEPAPAEPVSAEPRPARGGLGALGRALLGDEAGGAGAAPAEGASSAFRGEWGLYLDGSEVVTIRFEAPTRGVVRGSIGILGTTRPFSATPSGGALEFPFAAVDGTPTRWHLAPRGAQLAATVTAAGETQRHLLDRRDGWSDTLPLARRWHAALAGRSFSRTTRAGGGGSGGATTEFTASFCAGGVLAGETRSVVSVYVPGASGSQTGRESSRGTWRVVARGGVAAVITSLDGETLQVGVREGDGDTIYFADQFVRLGAARCP